MGQFKNTDPKDTPEDKHDKSEDDYPKPEPENEPENESVSSSSTPATSSSSSSTQPPPSSPSSPSPAFIARQSAPETTRSSPCELEVLFPLVFIAQLNPLFRDHITNFSINQVTSNVLENRRWQEKVVGQIGVADPSSLQNKIWNDTMELSQTQSIE